MLPDLLIIAYFSYLKICIAYKSEVTVDDHPSLWPGHLEPLGSKQNVVEIESTHAWPSPTDFFKNFVDKSKPMLFKGVAKKSPAFHIWDDEYLLNLPESANSEVYVEPEKKENRLAEGKLIKFKHFLQIYKNESIYMVHGVPKHVRKDVLMPSPLRCDDTMPLMLDAVTWFSSGGTKSVLHNDDLDNVNCLFRGSKEILFIDYEKNKKFVPIDNLRRAYSSLDVEKVDYVKYPDFRKVDKFIKVSMKEGDCVFIPYKWYHQVNSEANEKQQNIAVNIWFTHKKDHRPIECYTQALDATIDKYVFRDLDEDKYAEQFPDEYGNNDGEQAELVAHFESYLIRTKKQRANFKTFVSIYLQDPTITSRDITKVKFPKDFKVLLKQLFNALDVSEDGWIDKKDFELAAEEEHQAIFHEMLLDRHRNLLNFLDQYLYNYFHRGEMRDEL